ncbi:MAG TPA: DUF4013 domain-containing protein [Thermoanaerobaculia bacterium]|nr:DUF4013 domain-containing protein [Thermoanaerobaculia bacterium]
MSDVQYTPPPPPPPPPPVVPPALPATPQFDFAKPFSYVFDDPRWVQKILIGGLFYLAGFLIVGWFFVFGYVAHVTRNVAAGHPRPLPEWDDLGGFFSEGARLIGVMLLYFVPMFILGVMFVFPSIALDMVDHEAIQALGGLTLGCLACLLLPLWLAIFLFLPASLLFTMVEQRFGAAFEFGRIWRFIRVNVANYLLAILILVIARFIGEAGIGVLCIGVIFTGFWSLLISAHAFAQVHRLDASR